MDGRAFLAVARALSQGPTEAHRRTAAGRAYYGLFLECRDALLRWGISLPSQSSVHRDVRLRFTIPGHAELFAINLVLEALSRLRTRADYEIATSGHFATANAARNAVTDAENTLARLDALDADPALRSAAIAAFP
jgi:uncharacterized protein (UPF0332 family)